MGLDVHALRFLLEARAAGICMEKTATLGRQSLAVSPGQLSHLLREFGITLAVPEAKRLIEEGKSYADLFLKQTLGVCELTTFDASDYEDASCILDMNYPIPDEWKDQFDLLIDGGTLEHVFNYPTAIKNGMEMVCVGGRFLLMTPANNAMGHGFYQFSPELFYRVFHPDNGYTVERMLLLELRLLRPRWFEVRDPAQVHQRVMVTDTCHPSILFVQARRTERKPVFAVPPQQSDYSQTWEEHATGAVGQRIYSRNPLIQSTAILMRKHIHHPVVQRIMWMRYKGFHTGSFPPRFFKRVR
jgi:hypothetical protein